MICNLYLSRNSKELHNTPGHTMVSHCAPQSSSKHGIHLSVSLFSKQKQIQSNYLPTALYIYQCHYLASKNKYSPTTYLQPTRRPSRLCHDAGYIVPSSTKDFHKFSFLPRTTREWNVLPPDIVKAETLEAFKQGLNFLSCA